MTMVTAIASVVNTFMTPWLSMLNTGFCTQSVLAQRHSLSCNP
jgi:hypothetical protein